MLTTCLLMRNMLNLILVCRVPTGKFLEIYSNPVFFNLFSEVEPFAAVLIAHRTHGFQRTPEAQMAKI